MSPNGQPPDSILCTTIENINDFKLLQKDWSRLWRGSRLSFFSSWEWSWAWWETYREYLSKSARLKIFVYRDSLEGEVLAILPAYERTGLFGIGRDLTLLGIGEPVNATIYTEFLDLICEKYTQSICAWVTEIFRRYDQINLGILRTDSHLLSSLNSSELKGINVKMVPLPNYRANLSGGFDHYLSQLSPNTRNQSRKILRQLDEHAIELKAPDTDNDRLLWFNQLVKLHQNQWNERGKKGAFNDPRIIRFHTILLSLAPQAHIYRLANSSTVIGYLYGFITPERFDWYQMGIDLTVKTLQRPGYALHLSTIRRLSTSQTTQYYEFLPGVNQLKKQLGPLKEDAFYIEVCKSTIKHRLISLLSVIVHRWRKVPRVPD